MHNENVSRYGLIQTALRQEYQAVARGSEFGTASRGSARGVDCVLAGQACRLIQTGIGSRATQQNLSGWLRENPRPDWILSIGFAGGLKPQLRVGDCVVASIVIDAASGDSLSVDSQVRACAGTCDWIADRSSLVTLARPAFDCAAKAELFASHSASACDMETYAVARIAQDLDVPWLSVRIISDCSQEQIPRWMLTLGRFIHRGKTLQAVRLIAGQVHQLPHLARMAMRMRRLQTVLCDNASQAVVLAKRCAIRNP